MLSRWQSTIVDAQGNVQPGARLVVFLEATQERAQVYRDRDGTDPYPLGEVVANEWGYAYFYADPNSYRITSAPLAIDWREVVVAGEWLLEAESNAAQSAAQALLSAQSATASAATASTSASAASDSAANAESSETNAAGSAASAQSSATQASNSAADAANYASNAAQSATDSASHADSAQVFSQDAESSKALAEQWAQNPEDVPVAPGLFSAFHWARKAMEQVAGVLLRSNNLSDVQDAAQARTNLGLGTAATRDVTTSNADVTAGRLLKVGDLGSNKRSASALDFNELPDLYPYSGPVPVMSNTGSSNKPPKSDYYYVEQHFYSSNGNVTQVAIPYRVDSEGMWMRSRYQGTWSPWREVYHSGNLPDIDWNSLTGKPSTFPPSSHTHTWSQITGAPATATRWPTWNEVTEKPSGFTPPTGHGGVGTYAFVNRRGSDGTTSWGATISGGNLAPSFVSNQGSYQGEGTALSGTWRIMGRHVARVTGASSSYAATLAVRIA